MSDNINSNIEKRFLDEDGLKTLWKNINDKFANNSEAIESIYIEGNDQSLTLSYRKVDGTSDDKSIQIADDDHAGIITANTYKTIQKLQDGDPELVPFKKLNIDGKETSIDNNDSADIKLELETVGDYTYITLVDSRFSGGAKWVEIEKPEYDTNTNNGLTPTEYYKYYSGTYWKWVSGKYNNPPVLDKIDNPIIKRPESKIDATKFIKDGFLNGLEYITDNGHPELILTFNTYDGTTINTETIHVNLSDLIDVYEPGEGILITSPDYNYKDNNYNTATIQLAPAEVNKLGGVKIAKDNNYNIVKNVSDIKSDITNDTTHVNRYRGIEVDSTDVMFVYVPWKDVEVNDETYLTKIDDEKSLTTSIDLSDTTKQSLSSADSALQEIKILNEPITQDFSKLTVANAIKDLALGTAAGVNITEKTDLTEISSNVISRNSNKETTTTSKSTVPTTTAVKTYVDNSIENAIEDLDSIEIMPEIIWPNTLSETDPDHLYFKDKTSKVLLTKLVIENGKIVNNDANAEVKTEYAPISIYDIFDFAPITTAQIHEICK